MTSRYDPDASNSGAGPFARSAPARIPNRQDEPIDPADDEWDEQGLMARNWVEQGERRRREDKAAKKLASRLKFIQEGPPTNRARDRNASRKTRPGKRVNASNLEAEGPQPGYVPPPYVPISWTRSDKDDLELFRATLGKDKTSMATKYYFPKLAVRKNMGPRQQRDYDQNGSPYWSWHCRFCEALVTTRKASTRSGNSGLDVHWRECPKCPDNQLGDKPEDVPGPSRSRRDRTLTSPSPSDGDDHDNDDTAPRPTLAYTPFPTLIPTPTRHEMACPETEQTHDEANDEAHGGAHEAHENTREDEPASAHEKTPEVRSLVANPMTTRRDAARRADPLWKAKQFRWRMYPLLKSGGSFGQVATDMAPYLLDSTPQHLSSCFDLFRKNAAAFRHETLRQHPHREVRLAVEQWQSDETGLAFTTVHMNCADGLLLPVHVDVSETTTENVDLSAVFQEALGERKNMVRHAVAHFLTPLQLCTLLLDHGHEAAVFAEKQINDPTLIGSGVIPGFCCASVLSAFAMMMGRAYTGHRFDPGATLELGRPPTLEQKVRDKRFRMAVGSAALSIWDGICDKAIMDTIDYEGPDRVCALQKLFALAKEGQIVLPDFADPTRWEDLVAILNECQRISPQIIEACKEMEPSSGLSEKELQELMDILSQLEPPRRILASCAKHVALSHTRSVAVGDIISEMVQLSVDIIPPFGDAAGPRRHRSLALSSAGEHVLNSMLWNEKNKLLCWAVLLNPYMRKECALRELLWSYEFVDERIAELQDFFNDFWVPDEPKPAPKKRPITFAAKRQAYALGTLSAWVSQLPMRPERIDEDNDNMSPLRTEFAKQRGYAYDEDPRAYFELLLEDDDLEDRERGYVDFARWVLGAPAMLPRNLLPFATDDGLFHANSRLLAHAHDTDKYLAADALTFKSPPYEYFPKWIVECGLIEAASDGNDACEEHEQDVGPAGGNEEDEWHAGEHEASEASSSEELQEEGEWHQRKARDTSQETTGQLGQDEDFKILGSLGRTRRWTSSEPRGGLKLTGLRATPRF